MVLCFQNQQPSVVSFVSGLSRCWWTIYRQCLISKLLMPVSNGVDEWSIIIYLISKLVTVFFVITTIDTLFSETATISGVMNDISTTLNFWTVDSSLSLCWWMIYHQYLISKLVTVFFFITTIDTLFSQTATISGVFCFWSLTVLMNDLSDNT